MYVATDKEIRCEVVSLCEIVTIANTIDNCLFRQITFVFRLVEYVYVQLDDVSGVGELLVDIHSQYQNLLLHKEGFLLDVLDVLVSNREMLASR